MLSTEKGLKKSISGFYYDCLKIIKNIIGRDISGTVIEIGAGTAITSCYISKFRDVNKIYTL